MQNLTDTDGARQPRSRWPLWRTLRLAVILVGSAVLVAILVLPRSGKAVPASGTGSPGPTFNVPAALNAQVDEAGLMRSGGIWAVQGSYLLTSTDDGETWRAGSFPAPGGQVAASTVFVLDPDHAWAIESGPIRGSAPTGSAPTASPTPGSAPTGSAPTAGTTPAGTTPAGQPFVVDRTRDGGRTWQQTAVSGGFRCDTATLSFVDADHGFVMCSFGSTSGPSGPNNEVRTEATKGSGTVLRTDDGGATWSLAGGATGLGSGFTASDANTLWSAPDYDSSWLTGAALHVSRDAGLTWSTVDLPDLPAEPAPANAEVVVAAGPAFWDASDGAIAVGVSVNGSGNSPAAWFYRTSDGGRSWTLVKHPSQNPMTGIPNPVPAALVGRAWAVVGTNTNGPFGLTVSSDFGASWTDVPGVGMPENGAFEWVDFADKDHAIATVNALPTSSYARVLMLSSDGGRTWHPADFGNARANVPANSSLDPVAAGNIVDDFETMAIKDPSTAWNMLSSYSQRAFGGEPAFASEETALGKRVDYAYQLSQPTRPSDLSSESSLGPTVWADLNTFADLSRTYVVVVTFPGTSEPPETVVAAPLSATGEWRVWMVALP